MSKSRIPEVNPSVNFSEMEDRINEFWKEKDIFKKSIERRPKEKRYSFVDGPPFVSGMPHYGTLLVSIPKDIIPRYWTMKGYRVRRVWGWDCHGLPIETKVNEKYGIKDRYEIEEKVGVDNYVRQCREFVEQHIADWRWYIEKIGRWVDLDNAYRTMDPEFNESVIWAFKKFWDEGYIYKGKRVSLYSTDTSTPVSSFEVGMDDNYKDVEDLSIFVKFEIKGEKFKNITGGKPLKIVAWTTTPWTIPANFALVVNPEFTYSVVKYQEEYLVMAKDRLDFAFEGMEYEVVKELKGDEFEGLEYVPAYDYYIESATENDWHIYTSDEVIEDEGTGVLHVAPGFGEVDFNMGQKWGLSDTVHIDDVGNLLVGEWKGVYIRDASDQIAEDLRNRNLLLKSLPYVHGLPFYRGKNPLIYMAQDSYFVDIQKIKGRMLELEKKIKWIPSTFKKRFHNVIETSPDWAVSRNRYWATIMPIWKSGDGDQIVVGSIEEMMEYTDQIEKRIVNGRVEYMFNGRKVTLHRDVCDKIVFKKDGKEYRRIPEVLDCWMDSGSVPFAEHHYPFENIQAFEQSFPADFIVEYTGQIRAWFNVLFRMSTILFDDVPYKNVVCHGVLFGNDGRKMSKEFKNYPDPRETLEKKGGEALRLYFMSTPIMAGGDINWSDDLLNEQVKNVLIPLWNTFRYLTMYANIHGWTPENTNFTSDNLLDKWLEEYMKKVAKEYSNALENYDIPSSVKVIQPCIDNISKWWIRRSRDRFALGDTQALQTLYASMVLFAKIFAPQMPFVSEEIYQTLVVKPGLKDAKESVHLEDYPVFSDEIDEELLKNMEIVREVCSNGLKLREDTHFNLRQPLAKAYIGLKDEILAEIVKSELNVLDVQYSEKPVEGEGLVSAGDYELFVTLDINLTDELKAEGYINEFLRRYRDLRKRSGLKMGDKIAIRVEIQDEVLRKSIEKLFKERRDELQVESAEIVDSLENFSGKFSIDGKEVKLSL